MKQVIALFIMLNFFSFLSAQQNCILAVGDSCHIDKQGTQLRSSPNYSYHVIETINDENTDVMAEVIGDKVINGYVKVKLIIPQLENSVLGHLNDTVAWVKKNYLDCFVTINTHSAGTASEDWDNEIIEAEELKKHKRCTYSADSHAGLLLDRGRARYAEKNYEGAVTDITNAIDLPGISGDLIIYYWYSAHAKSGLGDYQGAINDFDYIIDNKEYLEAYSDNFNLNDVLCWKAQNLYFVNEDYKAKSVLNIVIASDPENGFAYYLRGLVKCYLEDMPGGCKDLSKAAELGFNEAYAEIEAKCK